MKKIILFLYAICSANAMIAQTPFLVRDIKPGILSSNPIGLTSYNGYLYFFADDGTHGLQLWRYNEVSLPEIVQSPDHDRTGSQMTVFNNKLYFPAHAVSGGYGLFVYDGITPPILATGIILGATDDLPYNLAECAGKLYFTATAYAYGNELYSYDGTNPPKVYDFKTGMGSSSPHGLTAFNGKLCFAAQTSGSIWSALSLNPVNDSVSIILANSFGSNFTVAGGKLYFAGPNDALYSFSGSGTAMQLTSTGMNNIQRVFSTRMAVYQNALYFGGLGSSSLTKLYKYDLAGGNITAVTGLFFDPQLTLPQSSMVDMQVYNSALYFSASVDSANGVELYKFDGSSVSLVADINSGAGNSSPSGLTICNGHLYMNADDGTNGRELYRLNGTTSVQNVSWNGEVTLYPNPANTSATLSITLQSTQSLRISLTDVAGREVFTTTMQSFGAGQHKVTLPMLNLAAGQYFYRINGSDRAMLANGAVIKQ